MINNISSALNAYQQALVRIGSEAEKIESPITEAQSASESGFGSMVKSALEDAVSLNQQSEKVTIAGIQGKADIQDVVLAVSNAEQALETVVAVRDTAIKAYNTIMQMPI